MNPVMDPTTVARLNAINRDFYATVTDDFDTTRGKPWPGWQRLLPHLKLLANRDPLRVLDAGCGNGRFGVYLAQQVKQPIAYFGIDNNPTLLDRARSSLAAFANLGVTLIERDIIESPPIIDAGYDLIVLFGVLHHVPGSNQREALLRQLAESLSVGGLLAFSAWRFMDYDRFRERVVPWPADLTVEPGDYLLDWRRGAHALRYCHYTDDAEFDNLVASTGLTRTADYRADGQPGDANRYAVLRKP